MKKFISGLACGIVIASTVALAASYVAEDASFKVFVNGKEFTSSKAVVIDGSTYLPLRAMGDVLGVPVNWNNELHQVEVGNMLVDADNTDVENFIVGKVWNDGLWWISECLCDGAKDYYDMYISTFADSYDEKIDVQKIVDRFLETKLTMDLYNDKFASNEKWVKLYNEYNRLYELVANNSYNEENFKLSYFTKVRDEFCDSLQ